MFFARWFCLCFSLSLAVLSGVLFIQRQQPAQPQYIITAYGKFTLQQIYRIRADGQEIELISPIQTLLPGWVQERAWLYFISPDPVEDQMLLYRIKYGSLAPEYLVALPDDVYDYGIHWSPDGSEIVYATATKEEEPVIYQTNLDTNQTIRLEEGQFPRWSPNGELIAFIRPSLQFMTTPDGQAIGFSSTDLYIIRPNETQTQLIREFAGLTQVYQWALNSQHILGITATEGFFLVDTPFVIIDIENKTAKPIEFVQPARSFSFYGFQPQTFDVSPNSEQLGVLHPFDRTLLMLMTLEGITESEVVLPDSVMRFVNFSSDGQSLLAASEHTLYRINLASGEVEKLHTVPRASTIAFASWMPTVDMPFHSGFVLLGILLLIFFSSTQKGVR